MIASAIGSGFTGSGFFSTGFSTGFGGGSGEWTAQDVGERGEERLVAELDRRWRELGLPDTWESDLLNGDGRNPGRTGYGLMAWLVLHGGFGSWLGTSA